MKLRTKVRAGSWANHNGVKVRTKVRAGGWANHNVKVRKSTRR